MRFSWGRDVTCWEAWKEFWQTAFMFVSTTDSTPDPWPIKRVQFKVWYITILGFWFQWDRGDKAEAREKEYHSR